MLDDLFTYWLEGGTEQRFLTVVNASNAATDFGWIAGQAQEHPDVEVLDRSEDYAMLALQGPDALAVFERGRRASGQVPGRFRRTSGDRRGATSAGLPHRIHRRGRRRAAAGPGERAPAVWDALVGAGATPAGLGARDTLRMEVCYPLYGNDLSTERTPIEAGLAWACALDKDFIGAERLREQREHGTDQRLAPFVFTKRASRVPAAPCWTSQAVPAGEVTSGTLSPCMDVGIGMAYVRSDLAQPGTDLVVDVRGKQRPARVESKPLYRKEHRG